MTIILFSLSLAAGCMAPDGNAQPEGSTAIDIRTATATAEPSVTPTAAPIPTLIPQPTGTITPTPLPTATPLIRDFEPVSEGIWISPEELSALPMEGRAWERLEAAADGAFDVPNMAGYTSNHDVQTLAAALVYARSGEETYREKVGMAIRGLMGTEFTGLQDGPGSEQGALALIVGRNLVSYVIAADLIDLSQYDAQLDDEFRAWIEGLVRYEWADGSLISEDELRANTRGRMAGASRAAVAAYLGNEDELRRAATVFRGYLGDRETYTGFRFDQDLSWQADPAQPAGVNPAGATKEGFSIDGALPEDMRRGCSFQIPPCHTDSPWESLQGIVVEANILHRQGFDAWHWQDQAILRAAQFLDTLQQEYPDEDWWAEGDDTWIPWVINQAYDADFPTDEASVGKNMSWTDWTHAP